MSTMKKQFEMDDMGRSGVGTLSASVIFCGYVKDIGGLLG